MIISFNNRVINKTNNLNNINSNLVKSNNKDISK